MAHGFRRRGTGSTERFTAKLDPAEAELLIALLRQTHDLLDPPPVAGPEADAFTALTAPLVGLPGFDPAGAGHAAPVAERDPALARLLPSAHRSDEEAAAEFRRLTESGLRRRKADSIDLAISGLRSGAGGAGAISLDRATATAVLMALTDVRLVLGERMGLREDADLDAFEERAARLPEDHPQVSLMAIYDFLTWLQETLAHALLRGSR